MPGSLPIDKEIKSYLWLQVNLTLKKLMSKCDKTKQYVFIATPNYCSSIMHVMWVNNFTIEFCVFLIMREGYKL